MTDNKFYTKFEKKQKTEKKSRKDSSYKKDIPLKESNPPKKKTSRNVSANLHRGSTTPGENTNLHRGNISSDSPSTQLKDALFHSLFSTSAITKESLNIINNFDELIQGVRPLNSKQIQQLPDNIRQLSHQLTDQRSSRRLGYMNESIQLSSYVRYYTWWNLVRLVRLFSNLPSELFPKENAICLDLGSGPLTVIIALWLARPELRTKKLTWYCLDVSSASMSLGEDLFLSVAAKTGNEPWKIIRVKGPFGTAIKEKCSFITCANMFNELDQSSDMPPEFQTKKYYDQLNAYASSTASFLLVEPGVPKAARTIALLRDRFIKNGKSVPAPCPHTNECPMNGFKAYTGSQNKWCNFAFSTQDAPIKLQKLSTLAKLPKERATLSFLCVSSEYREITKNDDLFIRINSDQFRLPQNKTGVYGCSTLGLTLVSTKKQKEEITELQSGNLLRINEKAKSLASTSTDEKSGATVISL